MHDNEKTARYRSDSTAQDRGKCLIMRKPRGTGGSESTAQDRGKCRTGVNA
jgi:hypothetical protein